MTSLSMNSVAKAAPAAAPRRNADREKLIDTSEFLATCLSRYNMHPALAVQGTAHRDSNVIDAKSGRHLVAAVNSRGHGYALLNSHFKDRRAHIGMCAVRPGTADMVIIDSTPVQRWKGFAPVLESFEPKWSEARSTLNALSAWSPTAKTMRGMAEWMAKHGYMDYATLRPTPESLFADYDGDALGFAFHLIDKMRQGRLTPNVADARRVRGIRRPDALFHAGMMAFEIVKERGRELGRVSARCSFVLHEGRLVRP